MRDYRLDVIAMYLEKSTEHLEEVIVLLAQSGMFSDLHRVNWEIGLAKLPKRIRHNTHSEVWLNTNVLEELFKYHNKNFDEEALNNWIHLVYTSDYPSDTNPYRD